MSEYNPLVSVIIPTYKNDGSLIKTIESVLNQSYSNLEIIVVDDNNPNSKERLYTEEIMTKYVQLDNINYIKHDKNKNGSAARNTGVKNSIGEYIALLDDDDYFTVDKIKLQVEYIIKNREYGAVYGGRYEGEKEIVYTKEGNLSKDLLEYRILPCTCSLLIKKEVYNELNGFNESYKRHQDFEFLLRFFEKYEIGVIKKPVFYLKPNTADNRLFGKDLEKQKETFLKEFKHIIEKIDKEEYGFKRSIYALHFSRVFYSYIKQGSLLNGIRVLVKYLFLCRDKMLKELYRYAKDYFRTKVS